MYQNSALLLATGSVPDGGYLCGLLAGLAVGIALIALIHKRG